MPEDSTGVGFHTGALSLDTASGGDKHQFLLCRVAVGRAFPLVDEKGDRRLPSGYDSLYVHREDEEGDDSAGIGVGIPPSRASQEYVVFESA